MNNIAMAGVVALFFLIAFRTVKDFPLALAGTVIVGFGRAVLLHGTNSAEPPVGLFFSVLSVCLTAIGCERDWKWFLAIAGLSMAYAMASYQSMVLLGPAAAVLCIAYHGGTDLPSLRQSALRLGIYLAGSALGVLAAWGWSSSHKGVHGFDGVLASFFELQGGREIYGYLSLKKIAHVPLGFLEALFPVMPQGATSIRTLLNHQERVGALLKAAFVILPTLFACGIAARNLRAMLTKCPPAQTLGLAAALISLVFLFFPLVYWSPMYDKLWLQPYLVIVLVVLIFIERLSRVSIVGRMAGRGMVLMLLACSTSNAIWAVPASREQTPYLKEAKQLEELVGPNDLLVSEWDSISLLYTNVLCTTRDNFPYPYWAGELGPQSVNTLRLRAEKAWARGGKVYFFSVLDTSPETWRAFLSARCGVPYYALEEFREKALPVKSFTYGQQKLTIRILPPRSIRPQVN